MLKDFPFVQPYTQPNKGDLLGTVWSSRNLDFEYKEGAVFPSNKLIVTTKGGETDHVDGLTTSFVKTILNVGGVQSSRWVGKGSSLSETLVASSAFQTDLSTPGTGAGTLTSDDDIASFNGSLYLLKGTIAYRRSQSSTVWNGADEISGFTNDKHLHVVFKDRLYVTGDTEIYSVNTSNVLSSSGSYTLDITAAASENRDLVISCIRAVPNGMWIGTTNLKGGRAKVFFWDGVTANTVELEKFIDSSSAMALTIRDEVPYILDGNGRLVAYNGSYFEEVARFDFEDVQRYRFDVTSSHDRWIHPNGMQTIDREILMAVNMKPEDSTDVQPVKHPSGIYAYNPKVGIYHKYSFTAQQDDTTVTDMGHPEIEEVGAIFPLSNEDDLDTSTKQSDFFVSYAYKSDNSTTEYVIAKNDKRGLDLDENSRQTVGLLTFTKWFSDEVKENWEKFFVFFKPFANSTDKLVLKYREQEHEPVETDITWVNTTTFTSSDLTKWSAIETGLDQGYEYEFEGLQGDGAGFVAQVIDVTDTQSGDWQVTLDETITGVTTNTAKCRVDRWTKVGEFTDSEELESYIEFNPEIRSTWIQYRLYMIGEDMEIQRILSKSDVSTNV